MELEHWPNEEEMIAELGGRAWADPEGWARRCRPEGCLICTSGRPFGILAELPHTWVTTDPEVAVFGYVCVISKSHAVEPFDLPPGDQARFWSDAMAVAATLHRVLQPIKMNYEIHGNTLPHLHMHLYPRRSDDAFVGRPIDIKETHHAYRDQDVAMLRSALEAMISSMS